MAVLIPPHLTAHPVHPVSSIRWTSKSGREIVIDDSFIDYMDLISTILGIEDYDSFQKMSHEERISIINKYKRDNKIEEILK